MKKIACIALSLLLLTACSEQKSKPEKESRQYITAVWISCYELYGMLEGGDFKNEFDLAAKKLASINASDAFVHIRAFGDSLFKSDYYPQSEKTLIYDFDVLEFMIEKLSAYNIRFHAWINPFRTADGSFNNPADEQVKKTILSGIREILKKYKVSGVHFDDYFYPSQDDGIDAETFSAYSEAAKNPCTLSEYRRAVITDIIFAVKNAVKHANPNIIFSISPAADMEKNKNRAFADVPYWSRNGAADWIIPQLYFGFDYPDSNFRFDNLLKEWRGVERAKSVKLIIGLPAYKLGTDTAPDTEEWKNGADILARQIKLCKGCKEISGVSFFSYSSLFTQDELHTAALKETKSELKNPPR